MTAIEYAIARHFHVLEETARKRVLTDKECEFLRRIAPLLRRLADEERKSLSRSRS